MNTSSYQIPETCDFSKVANNSRLASECTPKFTPEDGFEGLLINTPEIIEWPRGASLEDMLIAPNGQVLEGDIRFPLAGVYRLSPEELGIKDNIPYRIVVTAVDRKTAQSYSGNMRSLTSSNFGMRKPVLRDLHGNPLGETPNPGYVKGGYFNLDLVQNLGLPVKAAEYTVYASIGTLKSNVRVVKVTIK